MVERVRKLARDWRYSAVSIGYPGLVGSHGPLAEPGNLGPGWVGFDFAAAFECPVRIMNDAAMQALGSYDGGRMLFLGLGTGLGSVMIVDHSVLPLELVPSLQRAFLADYVVLGGGNSKLINEPLPPNVRLGHNLTAFRGGYRLWGIEDVQTQHVNGDKNRAVASTEAWRLL